MAWLLAFAALFLAAPAAAQTFPPLSGRVVDQANIIPDDREAALTQRLEELQRASSRQLVIATVASLEGRPIEDYGYQLGRHWGIGQSQANNGIILLVAPNERKVRIEVGYGLEPIVTDALSSQIINRDIVPRFRDNDYPGGIEAGANALIAQLAAPPEQAEQAVLEAERARDRRRSGGSDGDGAIVMFAVVFLGIIFLVVLVEALGGRRRRRVSPWGTTYGRSAGSDVGWFIAGAVLDGLLRGSRGGGSSWGGGGSSWGGGGSSWGGGGGGFSGGGGSFGGGGASGSW